MHLIVMKTQKNIFLCWKKIGNVNKIHSYNRLNQFCSDSTEQLKIALLTLIHATTVVLGFRTVEHHIHMFTSDNG